MQSDSNTTRRRPPVIINPRRAQSTGETAALGTAGEDERTAPRPAPRRQPGPATHSSSDQASLTGAIGRRASASTADEALSRHPVPERGRPVPEDRGSSEGSRENGETLTAFSAGRLIANHPRALAISLAMRLARHPIDVWRRRRAARRRSSTRSRRRTYPSGSRRDLLAYAADTSARRRSAGLLFVPHVAFLEHAPAFRTVNSWSCPADLITSPDAMLPAVGWP